MKLTRQQLEALYGHMNEVADNSHDHEKQAMKSIRGTNRVIYAFTGLGAILAILILLVFALLNKAIDHSVSSMEGINNQVAELRGTMDDITISIHNMGNNVQYLHKMSRSVNNITQSTESINGYMLALEKRTLKLGANTRAINAYASRIDSNFLQINQSVRNISYSVGQAVKPIQQFMPMP